MQSALVERNAAVNSATNKVAELTTQAADQNRTEEERAAKTEELKAKQEELKTNEALVTGSNARLAELVEEVAAMTVRRAAAEALLLEAEERKAQIEMAAQTAIFDKFKQEYNTAKVEYDELMAKDAANEATDDDYDRIDELVDAYNAN